jgi:hypothetical protein
MSGFPVSKERKEHLYKCERCNEQVYYMDKLSDALRKGHKIGGRGRHCFGILEWQSERIYKPRPKCARSGCDTTAQDTDRLCVRHREALEESRARAR